MKRCMIVDDSSVIRKAAKRILTKPDLLIVEAENGAEALDMCAVEMPDVVIVDDTLPDMTSAECIAGMYAIDGEKKTNIIVCVPEVNISTIMRAKRAGAKDYMLKPFDRASLINRFNQLQVAI